MRRSFISVVVLVVVIAACGGASTGGRSATSSNISTLELVAGAPERAAEARTARVQMTMNVPVEGATGPVTMDAIVDFERPAMQMSMNLRDFAPSAPDQKIEARLVDGVVYMAFGALLDDPSVPTSLRGKKWLKLDPAELGIPAEAMQQQQNPADFLDSLRGASSVKRIGPATIRGEDTTEYSAVINLRRAGKELGPEASKRLDEALSVFDAEEIPVRVWIGEDGLPRRQVMAMKVNGESMRISIDMFDFGVEVDVKAPPADETGSFSELLSAATSGLAGA